MNRKTAEHLLLAGVVAGGIILIVNRAHPAALKAKMPSAAVPAPPKSAPVITSPTPVPPLPTVPPKTAPVQSTRARLVDLVAKAIYKEVPARRLSPVASRTLAVNLVGVCLEHNYPLDLAFGHAFAESSLQLTVRNPSSGALGPLQVTPIAAKQVGVAWPTSSSLSQLEAGVKYMKWLRSAYPECGSSVRVTLQHYGMGRGNWLKYRAGQLTCTSSLSVVRAELGCPGNRPYSSTVIAIAKRHPELHTTSWWGS